MLCHKGKGRQAGRQAGRRRLQGRKTRPSMSVLPLHPFPLYKLRSFSLLDFEL